VAVLVFFKWEGDPDQHLAAHDREMMHSVPREQPRRISHTCARGDDGIVIVDVWESAEAFYERLTIPCLGVRKRRTGNPNLRSSPYTRYMLLSRR
jgi:hypothetical protein